MTPIGPTPRPRHPILRLTTVRMILVAAAVATAQSGISAADVRGAVGDGGGLALVAFVGLYAALTVAMFPGSVLSLAAAALFGALVGAALTLVGATLGAWLAFMLGRRLSRAAVESIAGARLCRADDHLRRSGVKSILVLRLVPLVPFNVLSYAAGRTSIRTRHYVTGTVLGMLPAPWPSRARVLRLRSRRLGHSSGPSLLWLCWPAVASSLLVAARLPGAPAATTARPPRMPSPRRAVRRCLRMRSASSRSSARGGVGEALRYCSRREHLRRTLSIAVVVGVILTAINQLDVILAGDASVATWAKSAANFLVPFVVSNLGLLSARSRT